MCYKVEMKKKNEERLQKKFDEENVPLFIQRYFIKIESGIGKINYWVVIKDLLLWLMEKKAIKKTTLSEIEPDDFYCIESVDITSYLEEKENLGMSPTTLETRKNIFRSFWGYLVESMRCPVEKNIVKNVTYKGIPSGDNLIKKLPSDEQVKAMEEKLANKNDDFLRIRNLAVFRLLKGSGLRESELVGLELSDIFLDEETPYVKILGKGVYRERQARMVYITNTAKIALSEWLEERSKLDVIKNAEAVFITKKGQRMSENGVKKLFKAASNSEISPHMMRHYYATVMTEQVGVVFVKQNLGHKRAETTTNNYISGIYSAKGALLQM